jgi:hypothetical protein
MPSCSGAAGARRAGYIDDVKRRDRHPLTVRALAAAVAFAAVAQAGGAPMCASLVAEAAAPCAMHMRGMHETNDAGVATVVAAPTEQGACHVDAASLGCAAGGSCPTGGTTAPAWINIPIVPRAASRVAAPGQSSALMSYLAPPLAPPPQA